MVDGHIVYGVDFDGTLTEPGVWPGIGKPNKKLFEYLIKQQSFGDKVILWTCREDSDLDDAINFCREHGLIFDAINDNLPEAVEKWGTNPRKIFCDRYIDDRCILWRYEGDEE